MGNQDDHNKFLTAMVSIGDAVACYYSALINQNVPEEVAMMLSINMQSLMFTMVGNETPAAETDDIPEE